MTRSSKEQTQASRARIIDVAGKLFRSKGYDTVTIADVMKAAKMTQGGFYKHFVSKEALASEVLKASFSGATSQWSDLSLNAHPTQSLIKIYLSNNIAEYRCPILAFGEDIARTEEDDDLRRVYLDGVHSLYMVFMSAESGHELNDSKLLFAAMTGIGLLLRAGKNEDWVKDIAAVVTEKAAIHA